MDLTNSVGAAQQPVFVTNVEYTVEEVGHHVPTAILQLRSRTADGSLVTTEVEGFRPYFALSQDDFVGDALEVCNDRRVIGAEVDCSPSVWADTIGVDADDVAARDIEQYLSDELDADIYHDPDPYTTIHDEPVARVFTREPGDVGGKTGIRADLDVPTFEADVPFVDRFLISTEIYQGARVDPSVDRIRYENWPGESDGRECVQEIVPTDDPPDVAARMVVYDIEVATEDEGFPNPERAIHPITSISAYDSYTDVYRLWGLTSDSWERDTDTLEADIRATLRERPDFPDDTDSGPDLVDVTLFDDETQLLESFHSWVLECDPDIFTGYNADGFDTPYLIQRSYNVQALSIKRYTPTGNPGVWKETFEGNEQVNFSLSGRSTLDILDAYKKTQFRELDSYTLAAVADAELDYGKLDVDGDELDTAWHERPVEFYAYSVRDTQATVGIEREAGLIDLFENLRRVTGARYERAVNNGPMLDTLFLRRAYEKGLVLPSNTEPDETVFHGARVFDPVPGVHKNCVYPDLSSLYPSLFAMLNLGSETIIGGKSDLEESEYTEDDCYKFPTDERSFATVPKGEPIDHIDSDEYKGVKTPGGGLRQMFDPQYDWQYVLKPEHNESFIRDTIDDLIDLKYQYKGEMYSAVKRVVNSCFTPDTEVMTPDGIVNIRNLNVGDSVYSINPHTMEVEVKSVTETIERPEYRGDLVNIQTQDIDLSVTPDHDLLLTSDRRKEDLWEVREAENITEGMQYALPREWDVSHGSRVETVDISEYIDTGEYRADGGELQHTGSWQTYKSVFNADDFVRFIGWYVAEGTVSVIENPNGSTSYRITLTQTESSEYRKDIEDLLDSMGVNWYCSDDRHLCFYNKPLSRFLIERCGRLSHTKRLPDFVWDISENQKRSLFDAMCNGDGDEDRDRYNTTSPDLRDDVCRLTLEFGNNPAYRTIEYDNGVRRDKYVIRYGDSKNIFVPSRTENDTADDGVYCVQVEDNHTLLAGRNGKFQWVPNCYGVMGDSASGGKGFRLYNRRVAEGITLAGRLTITHTAEQFTQYLQDNYDPDATLVGGDTDSATSSIPNAPDMETAWEWAHDAVEYVDASYDDFASETFDMPAEDHRLEVELESLASALFYMEGETDESYQQSDTGMLVKQEDTHGIRKRYAQAIVWDDDDGWIDTADPDEGYDEALSDPEDRSTVKTLETLDYDTFEDGPLDGMNPTDIVSITGFEYVRSDSAHITRDAQQQVLTHILFDPEPKDRIESYLTETVDAIEAGDVPLADLARPKGISQDLDEYGWKDVDELDDDDVTEAIEQQGGTWRQTPGPTYRGAKYADDWLPWEQLGPASKPRKIPIEKVRGDDYPQVYEYHSYPDDGARPDPPEVGRPVDAIAVSNPERLPDAFVVDTDTLIEKTLEDRLTDILDTMGYSYADLLGEGNQVGLDAFV